MGAALSPWTARRISETGPASSGGAAPERTSPESSPTTRVEPRADHSWSGAPSSSAGAPGSFVSDSSAAGGAAAGRYCFFEQGRAARRLSATARRPPPSPSRLPDSFLPPGKGLLMATSLHEAPPRKPSVLRTCFPLVALPLGALAVVLVRLLMPD